MKALKTVIKLLLVGLLMYWLWKRGLFSLEATGRALGSGWPVYGAILLQVSSSLLAALRWHWLLRAQNLEIRMARTFQLVFIGNFFNIALPGAVSGDFVKAFYVANELQGHRGRAFGSILFDRVTGLSALVIVSAGALLFGLGSLVDTPLYGGIRALLGMAALGVVAFYAYLFLVHEGADPVLRFLVRLEARQKKAGSLTRIYQGLRHYHEHRGTVLRALGASVLIHSAVCLAALIYARALGDDWLAADPVFVVVPLGLLATAVPILPGGVGTGHAAFGALFLLLGSKRGADVFNLFLMAQALTAAVGGIVYLRFRAREHAPAPPHAPQEA